MHTLSLEEAKAELARLGVLDWLRVHCSRHHVTVEDLLGHDRLPSRLVRARFQAWTVVRDSLALGWSETSRLFRRDHATVLRGVTKYESQRDAWLFDRRTA